MMGKSSSTELLEQEVSELTDLLRADDSFAYLRAALLSKGVDSADVVLASLIEDEDETAYGVILGPSRECIRFEVTPDERIAMWDAIDGSDSLASDFEAVSTAIEMMKSGRIS